MGQCLPEWSARRSCIFQHPHHGPRAPSGFSLTTISNNRNTPLRSPRPRILVVAEVGLQPFPPRQRRCAPLTQRGPQLIRPDACHRAGILPRHVIEGHRSGPRDKARPARIPQYVAQKQMGDTRSWSASYSWPSSVKNSSTSCLISSAVFFGRLPNTTSKSPCIMAIAFFWLISTRREIMFMYSSPSNIV